MTPLKSKVILVPCSGIGKSFGAVSREAAYIVKEDLRPASTEIMPLALLVMGDEDSRRGLANCPAIAIDGCKLNCAAKMIQECGGDLAQEFAVFEVYRRHRDFKPQGIAELNEGGQKLARALAGEIAEFVDSLSQRGGQNA